MGQLDKAEKMLADYNDVFADIVNVLLFDGEQVISRDSLQDTRARSQYKADDSKLHEQERDVVKFVADKGVKIALVGFEHQTTADADMPFRIMGYDGAAYRNQMLGESPERYPVVTLVLYFGNRHWNQGRNLHEALNIPDRLKPYVSNYEINVFEIAFLKPEQIAKFTSDFKIVADYFVQRRMNGDYKPDHNTIKHVDEMLKLMAVLTADHRFEEAIESVKKEDVTMCEVLDKVEARGIEKGIEKGMEKGRAEGRKEGREEILRELKSLGINLEELRAKKASDAASGKEVK